MLLSLVFNIAYSLAGHAPHEYVAWNSVLGALLWLTCWLIAGMYAVASWERGGQTLGMRPWRLRVTAADGGPAARVALVRRYVVGTLSLVFAGAGYWWAWIDRDRLTWHDRASGTRLRREAKPTQR
jgi:uncharacterized RDD family membrane protein YckC